MTKHVRGTTGLTSLETKGADDTEQRLQRLHHDILERLSAISLLASTAALDPNMQTSNLQRLQTIPGEVRVLVRLVDQLFEQTPVKPVVPVDDVVRDAIHSLMEPGGPRVTFARSFALVTGDRAALTTAVRELICDAIGAAGHDGVVDIHVETAAGKLALVVDDDAPGLRGERGDSGNLGAVHDFADAHHGDLTISRGRVGGGRRILRLPRAGG